MITKLIKWLGCSGTKNHIKNQEPLIIPRAKHNISRKDISKNALKVLYRLKDAGYQGFLVGGGIRDLLLGEHPKDFDITTDALPEEIRKLFRNCRLIGRRFRLAHIYFGSEIIEVSTFRATHVGEFQTEHGMVLRDNVYGTIEEDAIRRDFTINAIYYNIKDFSLIDYVGGIQDLKKRQLKIIGEPEVRYREDPVRMLRVVRFASKLNFTIHKETAQPIPALAELLNNIAPARLFEEYIKLFVLNNVYDTFVKLVDYGLYAVLFPQAKPFLHNDVAAAFIKTVLLNAAKRRQENKAISPIFILAAFLWHPVLAGIIRDPSGNLVGGYRDAIAHIIAMQKKTIAIPKSFVCIILDIWSLQFKLQKLTIKNIVKCYKLSNFRMAYDFLLLRASASSDDRELNVAAKWWQKYVDGNDKLRRNMLNKIASNRDKDEED